MDAALELSSGILLVRDAEKTEFDWDLSVKKDLALVEATRNKACVPDRDKD